MRAIESIVKQPMSSKIEIIAVDDGSTDSTLRIITELSQLYENVKCVHKQNGGVSSARNSGMDIAKGRYLNFTDADDWWCDGFFDDKICEILDKGTDIVCFSRAHISPKYNYCEKELLQANYSEYDTYGDNHFHLEWRCSI